MKPEQDVLTAEDCILMQQSVADICDGIAKQAAFSLPEHVCDAPDFLAAVDILIENGVVSVDGQSGCALWQGCEAKPNLRLTLANLAEIAVANPALALYVHRMSLLAWLLEQLNVQEQAVLDETTTVLCLHGRYGLGKATLAQWWQGQAIDSALVEDVFGLNHARWLLVAKQSTHAVFPVWQEGQFKWYCGRIQAPTEAQNHGLDELDYLQASFTELVEVSPSDEKNMKAVMQKLWHSDWLGLLAIQLGISRKAYKIANDYSQIRYQGGAIIAEHDAVKHMQSQIEQSIANVWQFLNTQALDNKAFYQVLLQRNILQEQMNYANHQSMQMMGGIGYMKDTGIEKCVRDANQLRLQSGNTMDMQHLAASWTTDSVDTIQWNFA